MVSGKFMTCPVLIINFAGEMLYILNQRLKTQSLSQQKCANVLNDICLLLFDKQLVDQLFLNNKTLSSEHLKGIFEKAANSTMMKLSPNSFSKLYDLMVMGVKLQTFLSSSPQQIYSITINHLEGILDITGNGKARSLLEYTLSKFKSKYGELPFGRYLEIKLQILNKFKNDNLRIYMFLENYYQDRERGFLYLYRRYSPHLNSPVGTIQYSDHKEELRVGAKEIYLNDFKEDDFRKWRSELGKNMYLGEMPLKALRTGGSQESIEQKREEIGLRENVDNSLTEMIRGEKEEGEIEFTLDLFEDRKEGIGKVGGSEKGKERLGMETKIENKSLKEDILKEIEVVKGNGKGEEEDDDLLDMMDEAMKF